MARCGTHTKRPAYGRFFVHARARSGWFSAADRPMRPVESVWLGYTVYWGAFIAHYRTGNRRHHRLPFRRNWPQPPAHPGTLLQTVRPPLTPFSGANFSAAPFFRRRHFFGGVNFSAAPTFRRRQLVYAPDFGSVAASDFRSAFVPRPATIASRYRCTAMPTCCRISSSKRSSGESGVSAEAKPLSSLSQFSNSCEILIFKAFAMHSIVSSDTPRVPPSMCNKNVGEISALFASDTRVQRRAFRILRILAPKSIRMLLTILS